MGRAFASFKLNGICMGGSYRVGKRKRAAQTRTHRKTKKVKKKNTCLALVMAAVADMSKVPALALWSWGKNCPLTSKRD